MSQRPATVLSRRSFGLLALLGVSGLALPSTVTAANAPIDSKEQGEMPTTGGLRPGPLGNDPEPYRVKGVVPIAIKIDKAQVDAQVETQEIIDGVMQNPSGPFVVSWYRETGRPGEADNIVMAGHLDYWDVGKAVFYNLGDLKKGDKIQVTGEDKKIYTYQVDWVKSYQIDDLNAKTLRKIVGQTDTEELTLITCTGTFDYNAGAYQSRMVVRASRVEDKKSS
jgi:LPXTG-site transpeptidase (sortase) family protein